MIMQQRYLHELLFLFRCNFLRILLCIFVSISLVGSTYYMSEEAHKDLTSTSLSLRNVNARSTIHCALRCEFEAACTSYSFNSLPTIASCVLYASTDLTFDVPEPGRQHFKKSPIEAKMKGETVDVCAGMNNGFNNVTKDGVTIRVFCSSGWTMVQSRDTGYSSAEMFKTDISGYEQGFEDSITENYWIGNEKLHILTRDGEYRMKVHVRGAAGNGDFQQFVVGSQAESYRLNIGNNTTQYTVFEELLAFDGMEFYATGFGDPAPASSTFFNGGGWWKPNGNATTCFNCFSEDGRPEIRLGEKTSQSTEMWIKKK